ISVDETGDMPSLWIHQGILHVGGGNKVGSSIANDTHYTVNLEGDERLAMNSPRIPSADGATSLRVVSKPGRDGDLLAFEKMPWTANPTVYRSKKP
ncbi:MAG: hypothetical protein AAGJ35_15370, partial [Myxococcota bacterium]